MSRGTSSSGVSRIARMNASSCVMTCIPRSSSDYPHSGQVPQWDPGKNMRTPSRDDVRAGSVPVDTNSERLRCDQDVGSSSHRSGTTPRESLALPIRHEPVPDTGRDCTEHTGIVCGLRRENTGLQGRDAAHRRASMYRIRRDSPRISRMKEEQLKKSPTYPFLHF